MKITLNKKNHIDRLEILYFLIEVRAQWDIKITTMSNNKYYPTLRNNKKDIKHKLLPKIPLNLHKSVHAMLQAKGYFYKIKNELKKWSTAKLHKSRIMKVNFYHHLEYNQSNYIPKTTLHQSFNQWNYLKLAKLVQTLGQCC